jgi:D-glycero-D-manno-heptose 1,7-bisphosphate phosphatase
LDASEDYHINLALSYVVGDRWKDIEAGKRAGCRTIWINRGYKERQPDQEDAVFVSSLKDVIDFIINSQNKMNGDGG